MRNNFMRVAGAYRKIMRFFRTERLGENMGKKALRIILLTSDPLSENTRKKLCAPHSLIGFGSRTFRKRTQ
ncbi:hypothetical protein [Treponema phagedenis]|nr:hypothetical protein [Treponema phagedenis]